jgi:hypothetical protein
LRDSGSFQVLPHKWRPRLSTFPRSVNRRRLIGTVLIFCCAFTPGAQAQTAITNANIGTAATAWLTSPSTAATTYGPIADWDTSAVTSMASLFYPSSTARPTFNADISKWNVASVSNMYAVCSLRSHRILSLVLGVLSIGVVSTS